MKGERLTTRKNPTNDELRELKKKLDELRELRNKINEVLGETSYKCTHGYYWWNYPYHVSPQWTYTSGKTSIQSSDTDIMFDINTVDNLLTEAKSSIGETK
jgi:hypothetical protein